MTQSRYGIDLSIGDEVKHFDRRTYDCKDMQEYVGVVVDVDPNKLPLVGVDCGVEFTRYIPHFDLIHCKELDND